MLAWLLPTPLPHPLLHQTREENLRLLLHWGLRGVGSAGEGGSGLGITGGPICTMLRLIPGPPHPPSSLSSLDFCSKSVWGRKQRRHQHRPIPASGRMGASQLAFAGASLPVAMTTSWDSLVSTGPRPEHMPHPSMRRAIPQGQRVLVPRRERRSPGTRPHHPQAMWPGLCPCLPNSRALPHLLCPGLWQMGQRLASGTGSAVPPL